MFLNSALFKPSVISSIMNKIGTISEWSLVLVFDTLVLALTVYKTYRVAKLSKSLGIAHSISYIILRDG